jgi:hypothetical protein
MTGKMEGHIDSSTHPAAAHLSPLGLLLFLAAFTVGGALLWWLMDGLSRTDISGDGWTLRGNGALIALLVGGPALLAMGWSMLAVWFKATGPRIQAGLLAGLGTLILSAVAGFGPVLLRDSRAGFIALPLAFAAGLGTAVVVGRVRSTTVVVAVAVLAVAMLLGTLAGGSLPLIAPVFVPLMFAVPLVVGRDPEDERLASARSGHWRLLGYFGVPAAIIAGFLATNTFFSAP